jgi:acyl-CoA reductase-like NAD-dependent aldehyde dehydrogenase
MESIDMSPAEQVLTSWVDGACLGQADGQPIDLIAPWAGTKVGRIMGGGKQGVHAAVLSARRAFQASRERAVADRAAWLMAAANEIDLAAESIVAAAIQDIGKPKRAATFEIGRTAALMRACAQAISQIGGEVLPLDAAKAGAGLFGFTRRVPYGVVGAVTPFNAPANLLMQKVAPALATGNAIVVKPSPEGTRVALIIAECFKRGGLPDGLYNVVPGGKEEALALAAHPGVDVVTITGGTAAGEALAQAAGAKKFIAELGGNSANIVLRDANIQDAAPRIAASAFEASGQQCISAQRVIVEGPIYDKFVAALVAASKKLRVGNPAAAETDLGPVVGERAADRIMELIDDAISRGATALLKPERSGCLIRPTILVNTPQDARIVKEEIFGPVVVIIPVDDIDQAIRVANDCDLGLQASCFTLDLRSAMRMSDALNVGSLWINEGSRFRLDNYPFGGVGRSGHGREGVRYAIEEYTQWKFTGIRLPPHT